MTNHDKKNKTFFQKIFNVTTSTFNSAYIDYMELHYI